MSVGFRVGNAASGHLEEISQIEKQCFSDPWSPEMLNCQMRAEDGIFLVAENEDRGILGYAGCRSVLDEGYITNVAVSPEFRRKGAADALISALIAWSRGKGLSFVTLEVRESNAPAIALYEKHGFLRVGLRRGYYEKPRETAVLMTLFLK